MKSMFYPFVENSCMYSHLFKGFYAIFTYDRIVANLNILTMGNGLCMFQMTSGHLYNTSKNQIFMCWLIYKLMKVLEKCL